MFQLDFGDHRPLYEQIKDKMKELIINGVLSENDKIPSVRELAASLAINPNTIQKAYKDLENEGYIYSQKAKGNFVSPKEAAKEATNVLELSEAILNTVREMKFLGVKKEDLIKRITEIYEEEGLWYGQKM